MKKYRLLESICSDDDKNRNKGSKYFWWNQKKKNTFGPQSGGPPHATNGAKHQQLFQEQDLEEGSQKVGDARHLHHWVPAASGRSCWTRLFPVSQDTN